MYSWFFEFLTYVHSHKTYYFILSAVNQLNKISSCVNPVITLQNQIKMD